MVSPGELRIIDELIPNGEYKPEISAEGTVSYPNVTQLLDDVDDDPADVLEHFATRGVLANEFVSKVYVCPECTTEGLQYTTVCSACSPNAIFLKNLARTRETSSRSVDESPLHSDSRKFNKTKSAYISLQTGVSTRDLIIYVRTIFVRRQRKFHRFPINTVLLIIGYCDFRPTDAVTSHQPFLVYLPSTLHQKEPSGLDPRPGEAGVGTISSGFWETRVYCGVLVLAETG